MNKTRRSFIWKLGAGASAAVAAAAPAVAAPGKADDPALRAALLEEEKALRKLHQDFGQAMDQGLPGKVVGLFAGDAEVVFNGGIFRHSEGIGRLYRDYLPARKAGASMQPAPGFQLCAGQLQDSVEVARDLRSATAVFPYSIQVGTPLESGNSLASMARLHGEGVRTWWEGGVYRVSYRKEAAGWRISRLEYDTLSRADYRPGRSHAEPISVARFSTPFPQDPQGPDALA